VSLPNNVQEYILDAGKLAPPAVVTTAASAGLTLEHWVMVLTIIYTVIQIALTLYKTARDYSARRARRLARELCRNKSRGG
jgi:hypothetical protein